MFNLGVGRVRSLWEFHRLKAIGVGGLILLSILIIFWWGGEPESTTEYLTTTRSLLVQDINATGKVRPVDEVNLAFEQGGTISAVHVSVGEEVRAGDLLLEINHASTDAQLSRAYADVAVERARLAELERGTRPEDLLIQEAGTKAAETADAASREALLNSIHTAYTKAQDAVFNRADQFFLTPHGVPQLNIHPYGEQSIEKDRVSIEKILTNWGKTLETLTPNGDVLAFSYTVETDLHFIKDFLAELANFVNYRDAETTTTQKETVFTARTNIDAAIVDVVSSRDDLEQAAFSYEAALAELALKEVGTASEVLAAQRARLASASATAHELEAKRNNAILRAPFPGHVAKQDAHLGSFVSAGVPLVTVLSPTAFEIETNIPEADIASIDVGDATTFTLDAFGMGVVFAALVTSVDTAETIIEGVTTYKVVLTFTDDKHGVRSGMTADLDIHADRREGVIAVPGRSILTRGADRFVRVLMDDGTIAERTVVTGLRGSDGRVEIVAGLGVGESVVVFSDQF